MRKPASSQLVDAIKELLEVKYHFRVRRNNVHKGRLERGGWVNCGEPGEADLTAYIEIGQLGFATIPPSPWGSTFAIVNLECKWNSGRQSAEQKAWQAEAERRGEFYLLAHSQEDVEQWLADRGIR